MISREKMVPSIADLYYVGNELSLEKINFVHKGKNLKVLTPTFPISTGALEIVMKKSAYRKDFHHEAYRTILKIANFWEKECGVTNFYVRERIHDNDSSFQIFPCRNSALQRIKYLWNLIAPSSLNLSDYEILGEHHHFQECLKEDQHLPIKTPSVGKKESPSAELYIHKGNYVSLLLEAKALGDAQFRIIPNSGAQHFMEISEEEYCAAWELADRIRNTLKSPGFEQIVHNYFSCEEKPVWHLKVAIIETQFNEIYAFFKEIWKKFGMVKPLQGEEVNDEIQHWKSIFHV